MTNTMFIVETKAGRFALDLRELMQYLRNACEYCVITNGSDLLELNPRHCSWEEVEQFVSSHNVVAVAPDKKAAQRGIYFAEIEKKCPAN